MAFTNPETTGTLIYPQIPEPLDQNAFIKLTSYKYETGNNLYGSNSSIFTDPERSTDKARLLAEITNQIFLPIPTEGLNISDSVDYETINGGSLLARQFNIFFDTLRKSVEAVAAFEDYFKATAGGMINNFKANLFNGMTLREFNFSWDFVPYSKEDALILKNIVNSIRKAALPSYDNNSLGIRFPDFWIVEPYINQNLLYELNFLVLADIGLSYDNSNGTTFFYDGNPVKTKLNLKFKEVYPAGSELIRN